MKREYLASLNQSQSSTSVPWFPFLHVTAVFFSHLIRPQNLNCGQVNIFFFSHCVIISGAWKKSSEVESTNICF